MITFWLFSAVMVAIALFVVLRPLRLDTNQYDIDRSKQNIAIAKDRLNELKADFEQGVINQSDYDKTREEVEQSLLIDIEQDSTIKKVKKNNKSLNRTTGFSLVFFVPVIAVALYLYLGQPELIDGTKQQAAVPAGHATSKQSGKIGTVEEMVEKLAAKLKQNPANAEGWFMLGRSYMSLGQFKQAAEALAKTNELIPNNPAVMLRYADALTMSRGGQISGKPFELIKRAVEIKPDEPTGLWLLGMGYKERGEYQKAISYWNLLLPLLKDDKSINEVQNLIRHAKSKAGVDITKSATNDSSSSKPAAKINQVSGLTVKVSLSKDMKKVVSENDTVFIFAKAVNGPPMPLAVVRKQVKDLPVKVILDDSMAMMPSMKLSSFNNVLLTARVSKSGKPLLQKGDLHSKELVINLPFTKPINLEINSVAIK